MFKKSDMNVMNQPRLAHKLGLLSFAPLAQWRLNRRKRPAQGKYNACWAWAKKTLLSFLATAVPSMCLFLLGEAAADGHVHDWEQNAEWLRLQGGNQHNEVERPATSVPTSKIHSSCFFCVLLKVVLWPTGTSYQYYVNCLIIAVWNNTVYLLKKSSQNKK